VGRKNRRNKKDYRQRLGFNPDKYTKTSRYAQKKDIHKNGRRETYPRLSRDIHKPERPYRIPYRGEIWVAQLGYHPNTSVQEGCRPVLIVSNDKGNHTSNTVVVLPLTSQIKRSELPSHVELRREDLFCFGPEEPVPISMVLAAQITTISKGVLGPRIGRIQNTVKLWEIDKALMDELGICGYIST